MQRAKRLLIETDEKIEVVASMSGYQSANSFCIAFKTPSACRRNNIAIRRFIEEGF